MSAGNVIKYLFIVCLLILENHCPAFATNFSTSTSVLHLQPDNNSPSTKQIAEHIRCWSSKIPVSEKQVVEKLSAFKPLNQSLFLFGFTNDYYWVSIRVKNNSKTPSTWYLTSYKRQPDLIAVYEKLDDDLMLLNRLDKQQKFSARMVAQRYDFTTIALDADEEKHLMIQVHTDLGVRFPFQFLTPNEFHNMEKVDSLLIGVFLAIVIAFFVSSLFQYFALGSSIHGFYAVLIFFTSGSTLVQTGYAFQFLWPAYPGFTDLAATFFYVSIVVTSFQMYRKVLDLKTLASKLDRFIFFNIVAWLLLFPAYFILDFHTLSVTLGGVLVVLYLAILAVVVCLALVRKIEISSFFLIAWLLYPISYCLAGSLFEIDWPIAIADPMNIHAAGILLEILLLAAAIGQDSRKQYQQRSAMQKEYITMLEARLKDIEALNSLEKERTKVVEVSKKNALRFASASHDMRQPLFTIRATLSALRNELTDESLLEEVDAALDYIANILRDIISDSHRFMSEPALFSLSTLFEELFRQNYRTAKEKGIQLHWVPSKLYVQGSKMVLSRIMDNMIKNAIRYTEKGKILYGVRRREEGLEIQVIDSGIGIEQQQIPKLLGPFVQGCKDINTETNKQQDGFGLGLTIIKQLCEENGYQFTIRSELGKGSLFSVYLAYG